MGQRGFSLRLADMIEAIERIHHVLAGVSLDAFEPDWQSAGWSNVAWK